MEKSVLCNLRGSCPEENYFRRTFELKNKPEHAVLRIFSDTGYEVFINGRFAVTLSEWANNRDYDLTGFFRAGLNTIAIRAINHSGHRGLAAELACDGVSVVKTDSTWRCFPREQWGWILPEFDDSAWEAPLVMDLSAAGGPQWTTLPGSNPAKVVPSFDNSCFFTGGIPKCVESPFYTLKKPVYTPGPEVLEIAGPAYAAARAETEYPALFQAQSLSHLNANGGRISGDIKGVELSGTTRYMGPSFIVDLGRTCVGYFRMKIESDSPVCFRLYHAETMAEATHEYPVGIPQNRMLREEFRVEKGVQEFEERMRFGGRFFRVEFFNCPAAVKVSGFSVRNSVYPATLRGFFHCSDPLLNRTWQLSLRTLQLCMQEYYLDAPKRDRLHWVGDIRMQALYNLYTFADTALFEFCWDKVSTVQYPDGNMPSSYGEGLSSLWDYTAHYVIAFREYYLAYGNAEFVLKHRKSIDRAIAFLRSKCGEDGLIAVPANPLGKLWMVTLEAIPGKSTMLNLLYCQSLATGELAAALDHDDKAAAAYAGQRRKLEPAVAELIRKNPLENVEVHLSSSPQFLVTLNYLAETQGAEKALALFRERFSLMMANECDTCTEGFGSSKCESIFDESYTPNYGSFCHGWSALALQFLPAVIAGITPLEPGWKKVKIAPNPCGLVSMETVVPTPHGEIALALKDGNWTIHLPEGISGELHLNGKIEILSAGTTVR